MLYLNFSVERSFILQRTFVAVETNVRSRRNERSISSVALKNKKTIEENGSVCDFLLIFADIKFDS